MNRIDRIGEPIVKLIFKLYDALMRKVLPPKVYELRLDIPVTHAAICALLMVLCSFFFRDLLKDLLKQK